MIVAATAISVAQSDRPMIRSCFSPGRRLRVATCGGEPTDRPRSAIRPGEVRHHRALD